MSKGKQKGSQKAQAAPHPLVAPSPTRGRRTGSGEVRQDQIDAANEKLNDMYNGNVSLYEDVRRQILEANPSMTEEQMAELCTAPPKPPFIVDNLIKGPGHGEVGYDTALTDEQYQIWNCMGNNGKGAFIRPLQKGL